MVETLKDLGTTLIRIITILPLLLFMTLFMGKRAIGELPIFDFLIVLTLGAVVGADIADPSIQHLPTALAIISLAIFQRIVSKLKISNRRLGKMITFEPTVVIYNGKFLDKNMKKVRYSIDNILQMLRGKGVFDINEVETAVIEANGSLSVLKKPRKNPVTVEDMNIPSKTTTITFPIIVEGKTYTSILNEFNLNEEWLNQQLLEKGIKSREEVFYASINRKLQLHVSITNESTTNTPSFRH
ncbi:Uncharacterized membrane protein YcaP, DUF421 family [Oceanobacillus limi]|uniref:Uncharacterized membrane protein YcaP, DUF421 family n=1 Tax=Oceanobacillus limi TaxID=930131 RepID=A0A1I0CUA2_9BACI|nr:DUF421 domain-containing protein [Oceanobacillus limi]SET22865.1 Uncharacterized membrane protein YcaP, DUF421 family [Oceanobacillus limi]